MVVCFDSFVSAVEKCVAKSTRCVHDVSTACCACKSEPYVVLVEDDTKKKQIQDINDQLDRLGTPPAGSKQRAAVVGTPVPSDVEERLRAAEAELAEEKRLRAEAEEKRRRAEEERLRTEKERRRTEERRRPQYRYTKNQCGNCGSRDLNKRGSNQHVLKRRCNDCGEFWEI